jgi:hypothetical protein
MEQSRAGRRLASIAGMKIGMGRKGFGLGR